MIQNLTDEQLEARMDLIEAKIHAEKDPKNLPTLNRIFQGLMDEQVRRDLEGATHQKGNHDSR